MTTLTLPHEIAAYRTPEGYFGRCTWCGIDEGDAENDGATECPVGAEKRAEMMAAEDALEHEQEAAYEKDTNWHPCDKALDGLGHIGEHGESLACGYTKNSVADYYEDVCRHRWRYHSYVVDTIPPIYTAHCRHCKYIWEGHRPAPLYAVPGTKGVTLKQHVEDPDRIGEVPW